MGFGLLLGLVAVALVWWLLGQYAKADPQRLAIVLRKGAGVLALGAAAFLFLRGRFDMGVALGGAGLWLLGYGNFNLGSLFGRSAPTLPPAGGTSRVRTASIEMELSHDSGDLSGRVLAGAFAGRTLDSLDQASLLDLLQWCRGSDPDAGRLLEAYLDRRFPGWREDADHHADAGASHQPASSAMTKEEAYQVLGLGPGASGDDIRKAHRALMKKLHPDQGGSTYLASRVNQAKDILLSQHL